MSLLGCLKVEVDRRDTAGGPVMIIFGGLRPAQITGFPSTLELKLTLVTLPVASSTDDLLFLDIIDVRLLSWAEYRWSVRCYYEGE